MIFPRLSYIHLKIFVGHLLCSKCYRAVQVEQ